MKRPLIRAAFVLAMQLGVWDVPRLLEEMPAPLFRNWLDFMRIEPSGGYFEELRMAELKAFVGNLALATGKVERTGGNYKAADFMPPDNLNDDGSMESADSDGENWKSLKNALKGM